MGSKMKRSEVVKMNWGYGWKTAAVEVVDGGGEVDIRLRVWWWWKVVVLLVRGGGNYGGSHMRRILWKLGRRMLRWEMS